LHDCLPDDCSPELLEFLRDSTAAGKIRAFGVGTSVESASAIAASAPAFASVLQFEHSLLRPTVDKVEPAAGHAMITHGALAGLPRLREHLSNHHDVRSLWSAKLELDCGNEAVLSGLMLQYALQTNRQGPVLFSSTKRENIVANAAAAAATTNSHAAEHLADIVSERWS
jgi:aryl-alcohol dehydrogenase-like predicted oxidoreductase